ncbi:hypothetical protein CPG37_13455 [Malaciobacter canalis]|uniref:HTH araC/xylS-type domain-containing protein n=1 Tax=Malaciobacter canalis TaxID=1912871 RepID=A0ABX4LQP0_9BACT|nr:AraC family transcriptional regulator [Malaciobacter canalis]PHO08648.1 hypothetical protein CPG37_13455 [Malaciobacter canalis]QEE32835.1 transcriptional regulator, AraC family [Malaciobacter canalis]
MISYGQRTPNNIFLKKYINSYTFSLGKIEKTSNKFIARAFPTFYTQLYFEFCGNISYIEKKEKIEKIEKRTYVNAGVGEWFDIFEIEKSFKNVSVKNFKVDLHPHTLMEVFNISPKELVMQNLRVEDIWLNKQDCIDMIEQIEQSISGEEMILIFEKYFLKLLSTKVIKNNNLYVNDFLNHNPSLNEFSKQIGFSTRWVQKEYSKIFGLTFKELQNNIRFLKTIEKIENHIASNFSLNFSLLAHECNYYDQAHFIKEFKKFTGMTPSSYVKTIYKDKVLFYW